ncbi:MAG: exonuclease SbcCD subunit D C-terminal domain-containing protein, partial [Clostridia bacterium]|nr:exonuclease SbcCD subunit D C-terminal domain-containing protein [Clostridia bacterium]
RQMRGTYEELVSPAFRARGNPDDYLRAILTDEEDIPDAVTKLRVIYPNLLRLCYDNLRTRTLGSREIAWNETGVDALTPEQVFAELWERQHGAPPDGEILRMAEDLFRAARGWEGGEDA